MTLTYFTQQNKDFSYCDIDFENWLGEEDDTPIEPKGIKHEDSPRYMKDKEIVETYNIEPMSLGEIAYLLKNSKDLGGYNLFFVKDKNRDVFVVGAYRDSGGWCARLDRFGDGFGWRGGDRVFFRTRDSLTLESRIRALEDFKHSVEKILKLT